jgi:hypothetical protein
MSVTVLMLKLSDIIAALVLLGTANFFVASHFPIKDLTVLVAIRSELALSTSLERYRCGG